LHELSIVDDTLEALGIPKEYQRLRSWIFRIIIGLIVYTFFDLALYFLDIFFVMIDIDEFDELEFNIDYIYKTLLIQYPEFVNILNALIWGTILGLVYRVS